MKSDGGRLGGRRRKWCDGWASAGWGGATSAVGGATSAVGGAKRRRATSGPVLTPAIGKAERGAGGTRAGRRSGSATSQWAGSVCPPPPQALPRNPQVVWLLALGLEQQRIPAQGRVVPVAPA